MIPLPQVTELYELPPEFSGFEARFKPQSFDARSTASTEPSRIEILSLRELLIDEDGWAVTLPAGLGA